MNAGCMYAHFFVYSYSEIIRPIKPVNVQDLDDKITRHTRDAHKIISVDNMMWMKIHKTEK
jgi:hypothetical protein